MRLAEARPFSAGPDYQPLALFALTKGIGFPVCRVPDTLTIVW